MSCSPCFIEHPVDCPRQLACLKDLSPAAVFSQCAKMLPQPSELASSFLKTPESRQLAIEE
jgi:hypothetical protein